VTIEGNGTHRSHALSGTPRCVSASPAGLRRSAVSRVYMVGGDSHYNPRGNHFFAYALKDRLLELLDPKPLPYQDRGPGAAGG
jgi:hypothetical protein